MDDLERLAKGVNMGKKIGGIPVGFWLAALAVGLTLGYLARRRASKESASAAAYQGAFPAGVQLVPSGGSTGDAAGSLSGAPSSSVADHDLFATVISAFTSGFGSLAGALVESTAGAWQTAQTAVWANTQLSQTVVSESFETVREVIRQPAAPQNPVVVFGTIVEPVRPAPPSAPPVIASPSASPTMYPEGWSSAYITPEVYAAFQSAQEQSPIPWTQF